MRKQAATRASRPQHLQPHGKCLRTKKLPPAAPFVGSGAKSSRTSALGHNRSLADRNHVHGCPYCCYPSKRRQPAWPTIPASNQQRLGYNACRRLRSEMSVRAAARSRALTLTHVLEAAAPAPQQHSQATGISNRGGPHGDQTTQPCSESTIWQNLLQQ